MTKPTTMLEEDLIFLDEVVQPPVSSQSRKQEVWRVMIIDDDADVHTATTYALGNLEMQKRPLQFLHAYSAEEAREMLKNEQDIAVILLDVVMEQEDAGLQLVRHIRETLGLQEVRIILRTGQPGYAPEIDAIRDFEINDYKTKSELTRIKLFTTVTAAIRCYEQIRTINSGYRGLDSIVHASNALMAELGLENFAAAVIAQVAGLLGQPGAGVLCMQEQVGGQPGAPVVIAAAGEYRALLGKPAATLNDQRLTDAITQAFHEHANAYRDDYV